MSTVLLVATLLFPHQDQEPAWQPAVSIAKAEAMALPWQLYEADGAVSLLTLGQSGKQRNDFSLSLHRSKNDGGFECAWTRPLGRLEGPPGTALFEGKLILIYPGEERAPTSRIVDLASGEASDPMPIAVEGLDKLEDDVWPMLVQHEARHFFLGARQAENELFLLRSEDGGKTWVAAGGKGWRCVRKDGSRPLLFALGGELHVLFHAAGETPGLAHFVSADAGQTWERRPFDLDLRAGQVFPMAVHAVKNRACVIVAEMGEERAATLRAAASDDGGKTWQLGGVVLATGLDDMSSFCHLTGAGSRLVFTGPHVDPKEGRESVRVVSMASEDGGKSWRDLRLGHGTERRNLLGLVAFAADGSLLAAFVNAEGPRKLDSGSEILFSRLAWAKPK